MQRLLALARRCFSSSASCPWGWGGPFPIAALGSAWLSLNVSGLLPRILPEMQEMLWRAAWFFLLSDPLQS